MNAPALEFKNSRPEYVGIKPHCYKEYILGLERITAAWAELMPMAEVEWEEVGDLARLGPFEPNFLSCMQRERQGRIGIVTVRRIADFELVGYFVGVMGEPMKTKGKTIINELAVYLRPDVRSGWLFKQLLSCTERFAQAFGADALIVSHRPEHVRIGKVYERNGYAPLSCDYIKHLDSGESND